MSDPIDMASEREEIARASALVTCRKPEGPPATGQCLWCDEPVAPRMRWCCLECSYDWNRAQ